VPDTLKSLRAELQLETRGDFSGSTDEDSIVNAAINDAIETIWMSMMQAHLARFFGSDSPVSFTLPQNTERYRIVSIVDPVALLTVGTVAGVLGVRNCNLAYTYVTESGSETNPSVIANIVTGANTQLQVTTPTEPSGLNAFGWNLYFQNTSGSDEAMALQNQQPLPFNIATYNEPSTGWQGYPTNQQTVPIINSTADNLSWIEHMEVRTSDTLLRSWNQVSIDSEVMRRMARTLSTASEYQHYVWELTGNGVLEFRPATGLAFSPRYWYVAKPRRLRYDQASIPYVNIPGVHKFIKAQAKADLFLGVNEFLNSQGWQGIADKEKGEIQMALSMEYWSKDARVVPHLF